MTQKQLRYELLAEVGEGTFGKVFKAREVGGKQRVLAVKKFNLRWDSAETGIPASMIREVALLRKMGFFNHPNIVKYVLYYFIPAGMKALFPAIIVQFSSVIELSESHLVYKRIKNNIHDIYVEKLFKKRKRKKTQSFKFTKTLNVQHTSNIDNTVKIVWHTEITSTSL